MSERCLIVADAAPSAVGSPAWRRARMFVDVYRAAGLRPHLLSLHADEDAAPTADAVAAMRALADDVAVAETAASGHVVEALDARWSFNVIHVAASAAPDWIGARRRAVRISDGVSALMDRATLAARAVHTDVFLTTTDAEMEAVRETGRAAVTATYLRRATRRPGRRVAADRVLAGCWIEPSEASAASAQALFDALRRRGGGAPPAFAIGGGGAPQVAPPPLPQPVLAVGANIDERVFYRGLDVALFPAQDEAASDVRLEIATALELGATPLVSAAALTGLASAWRAPRFDDLDAFAEYLFERGRDLRDGGLLAELRARADWTWSGLQGEAANQRAALMSALRERL